MFQLMRDTEDRCQNLRGPSITRASAMPTCGELAYKAWSLQSSQNGAGRGMMGRQIPRPGPRPAQGQQVWGARQAWLPSGASERQQAHPVEELWSRPQAHG